MKTVRKKYSTNDIVFNHAKDKYALEIPEKFFKDGCVPDEFNYCSKRQGFKRYTTDYIEEVKQNLARDQTNLENRIAAHVKKLMGMFLKYKSTWLDFCSVLKEFDCLISLSEVSFSSSGKLQMNRPIIENKGRYQKAFMNLKESKHYTLALMNDNFVENDIVLGDPASISLLTGSNMAGKSTLMKQVCIIAIMGQIGCYVPCKSAHFTVVDKVFSRIGASDRLNLGKSTFYIELEDMKHMVEQGTESSLCIVDELGRGTSVSEGVAIASAFLGELSNMKLRCMFSTHLHNLLKFTRQDGNIKYQKMAIIIDEDNELNFVHKLQEGATKSSFGLKVAKLAGIEEKIIERAKEKSLQYDAKMIGNYLETDKVYKHIMRELDLTDLVL